MKTLILTVGLPRSGKSTYAMKAHYPIVNPDAIRLAIHGERFKAEAEPMVWTIARYMVDALFKAGHSIVLLDSTSTTKARRDEWINKRWRRCFAVVKANKATCLARAKKEGDTAIVPIIERMADQYEPVNNSEYMEWEDSCLLMEV